MHFFLGIFRLLLGCRLILLLGGLNIHNFIVVTDEATDNLVWSNVNSILGLVVLVGSLDNLVRDGFLHQVYLALPDYFHQLVLKRDLQLLIPNILVLIRIASPNSFNPSRTTALRNRRIRICFQRRMHQEWIIFMRKVKILAEV